LWKLLLVSCILSNRLLGCFTHIRARWSIECFEVEKVSTGEKKRYLLLVLDGGCQVMPEIAAGSGVQTERDRTRQQEKQAFLGMKLVETGFLHYPEPFPHEMLFCGLYASYFLISFYSFLFLYKGCCGLNYTVEAIVSGAAFLLFVVSAFVSMYHAEKDIHLQYLTDEEECTTNRLNL
uniref:DUF7775 domain-containing protein n=1 Tax=Anopheles coluzzii TaxID=1518534 RepID=A0A8W7P241_ANOCL